MKNLVILILALSLLFCPVALAAEKETLDLPVKQLYAYPQEDSKVIYKIPIAVSLLEISEDGNWYKVKIAYELGPFSYTYVGWAPIPVAEILAKRDAAIKEVAEAPTKE